MNDALFPFGYGLSYTTFSVGEAKFSKTTIKANQTIDLTIPLSNAGKRSGAEVVQVYVHKVNDANGPIKTLKGFRRTNIAAGKSQDVTISLPYTSFEFYDRVSDKMAVTPGDYEIWYGTSSDTKDLKITTITIQ
jgi:beta-glucosidase